MNSKTADKHDSLYSADIDQAMGYIFAPVQPVEFECDKCTRKQVAYLTPGKKTPQFCSVCTEKLLPLLRRGLG